MRGESAIQRCLILPRRRLLTHYHLALTSHDIVVKLGSYNYLSPSQMTTFHSSNKSPQTQDIERTYDAEVDLSLSSIMQSDFKKLRALGDLYEFVEECIQKNCYPSIQLYSRTYASRGWVSDESIKVHVADSWGECLKAANSGCVQFHKVSGASLYSEEQLLKYIADFANECLEDSIYPTSVIYRSLYAERGWPSLVTLTNRISSSWPECLKAAGIEQSTLEEVRLFQALSDIFVFADNCIKNGVYPSSGLYIKITGRTGNSSYSFLHNKLGSWKTVLEASGIDISTLSKRKQADETNFITEILGDIFEFASECIARNQYPSSDTYTRISTQRGWINFKTIGKYISKSWSESLQAAGVDLSSLQRKTSSRRAPIEDILGDIFEFATECIENGANPTLTLYKKLAPSRGWRSHNCVSKNVSNLWSECLKAAGVESS